MEQGIVQLLERYYNEDTTKYLEIKMECMEHFAKTATGEEQRDFFYAESNRIVDLIQKENDKMKD